MNIVTCEFFLQANVENEAPIKKINSFEPNLTFYKNSFSIERNGIKEIVKPKAFKIVKNVGEGINTIDFFGRDFLKNIVRKGLLSQNIQYEAKINKQKGYILEIAIILDENLQNLYNKELENKAKIYFNL